MSTIIVKSLTGSVLPLDNLSAPDAQIPVSGSSVNLTDYNTVDEIQNDEQLLGYVTASLVILNDGTRDLNQQESENALISLYVGYGSDVDGALFKFDQTTGNIIGIDVTVDGSGNMVVNSGSFTIGPNATFAVSGTHDVALNELSDVSVGSAVSGNILAYNGTNWVPSTDIDTGEVNDGTNIGAGEGIFAGKSGLDLQFRSITTGSNNIVLTSGSTELDIDLASSITVTTINATSITASLEGQVTDISNHNLSALGNVSSSIDSAVSGNVLSYDGTNWVAGSDAAGETNTASNTGSGEGLFAAKVGSDLRFKSLTNTDNNLVITGSSTEVDISLADDVTIANNLVVANDLTVNGTSSFLNVENLFVEDPLITLASGNVAQTLDQGLVVTRSGSNYAMIWDESADEFVFAETAAEDGTTAGNVTITSYAPLHIGDLTAADINATTVTASFSGDLVGNVTGQVSDISNHTFGELSNVSSSVDSAASGTILSYDGSNWIEVANAGANITGSNLGAGEGVYVTRSGDTQQFKSLTEGLGIVLSASATEIEIALSGGLRDYGALAADPSSPSPAEGDHYYNTVLDMSMRYDSTRSKWLSTEADQFAFGRDGKIAPGAYYKGADGLAFDTNKGYPAFFSGTVVSVGYTRATTAAAVFEIVSDGSQIAYLSSSAVTGKDTALDGDFAPDSVLGVRNQSGGNTTEDVMGWVRVKWRI